MDGLFHGKPYEQMDDLGGKTPYFWKHPIKSWVVKAKLRFFEPFLSTLSFGDFPLGNSCYNSYTWIVSPFGIGYSFPETIAPMPAPRFELWWKIYLDLKENIHQHFFWCWKHKSHQRLPSDPCNKVMITKRGKPWAGCRSARCPGQQNRWTNGEFSAWPNAF